MSEKTVRLTHANGAAVDVPAAKVDGLLARGFVRPEPAAPRTRTKK